MGLRFVAVTYDDPHPRGAAAFWAILLGRERVVEADGASVPGEETQIGLRFVYGEAPRPDAHRLHVHLTSSTLEDQRRTVDQALRHGARHVDVGQLPDETHVVLADPGGRSFCVIEPGNNYLTGCGFFGEVTCAGSRAVGRFWSDALEWPIVWDRGEQIAIQSPLGRGPKIAWDGPPVVPESGWNIVRFDVAASEPAAEAQRLIALGASEVGRRDGVIEMTDVDGNRLTIQLDRSASATGAT